MPAILATILLLASIATYGVFTWKANQPKEAPEPAAMATTTPETATTTQEKPAQKKEAQTVYQPVYVAPQQPAPVVEVTNGVKNEGSGTVNYYQAPTQSAPPTASTPAFEEPREYTPLEIATEIVRLYDANGTAEYWGDGQNRIRVTAFGGKTVTVDLTGDWQENLKITLRKIK